MSIDRNDLRELIDFFDSKFNQIDKRFEQIDKRFEQIDKRFEQIDKRFEQIDERFEQMDRKFENRFKNQDAIISKINKKIDSFSTTIEDFERKLDTLYLERKENSIVIEKDINNYVTTYLSEKYPYSQIINLKVLLTAPSQKLYKELNDKYSTTVTHQLKKDKIIPLLNITDRTSLLLYPAEMNRGEITNPITELDGLYLVNYKDYAQIDQKSTVINVSELFIVEAKLSFNCKDLQNKLLKLKQVKELLTAPRNNFSFPEYRNFMSKYLKYIDKVSIFYGTPDWTFDLEDCSLVNNTIISNPKLTAFSSNTTYRQIIDSHHFYHDNRINQLYDDEVVYNLLDRPDLHFLKKTKNGYIGYNEVDSISGGSSVESNDS